MVGIKLLQGYNSIIQKKKKGYNSIHDFKTKAHLLALQYLMLYLTPLQFVFEFDLITLLLGFKFFCFA